MVLCCMSTSHITWLRAENFVSGSQQMKGSTAVPIIYGMEGLCCHRGARGASGPPEWLGKHASLWGASLDPLKAEHS